MFDLFVGVKSDLRGLELAALRANNLEPVLTGPVDKFITAFLVEQFVSEGSAGGAKWAPLSPETLEARKRPGHGRGGIGRDTNRMWSALIKNPSPEGWTKVTGNTYERAVTVPYLWYFSGGTWKQPARPVFPASGLPQRYMDSIAIAIETFIASDNVGVV